MGIYILINILEALRIGKHKTFNQYWFNAGPSSQVNGQTQYGAGRDDGHVGHAPSDERTYCELQVI